MNTRRIGVLVGRLIQELENDADFMRGYQEGIANGRESTDTILIDMLGGPNATITKGTKIKAIKAYREATNCSLRDAVEHIKQLMKTYNIDCDNWDYREG